LNPENADPARERQVEAYFTSSSATIQLLLHWVAEIGGIGHENEEKASVKGWLVGLLRSRLPEKFVLPVKLPSGETVGLAFSDHGATVNLEALSHFMATKKEAGVGRDRLRRVLVGLEARHDSDTVEWLVSMKRRQDASVRDFFSDVTVGLGSAVEGAWIPPSSSETFRHGREALTVHGRRTDPEVRRRIAVDAIRRRWARTVGQASVQSETKGVTSSKERHMRKRDLEALVPIAANYWLATRQDMLDCDFPEVVFDDTRFPSAQGGSTREHGGGKLCNHTSGMVATATPLVPVRCLVGTLSLRLSIPSDGTVTASSWVPNCFELGP
jgi:hypothetical protein